MLIGGTLFLLSCSSSKNITYRVTKNYKPDNQTLYDTIVRLDSIFFAAYNNCSTDLERYGAFYSDDIEFYHDQAGLNTSRQDIIDGTEKNICGKVTRELVKGSIEVYPIRDFGAVEFGLHKFHNNQQPEGSESKVGRFVIIWEHIGNEWKIKSVISLH
jgi:ketosteroid isomerase-like protein